MAPKSPKKNPNDKLVRELNKALGWELRASAMYAHYAAYVQGIESLPLEEHFSEESVESMGHARKVRDIISEIGGLAVTDRDPAPIVHTTDSRAMLEEALKTERGAAAQYAKILPMLKSQPRFTHSIMHILMDEQKAVVEVEKLLAR